MKRGLTIWIAVAGLLGLAACDTPGLTRKGAKTPAAAAARAKEPVGQTTTTGAAGLVPLEGSGEPPVTTAGLSVSDAIAKACGIAPRTGDGSAARFDFDSAALAPEDREMLGELAKCLTEGALRGRPVSLVGRADPRGESEYNMGLGGSRADAVERYLIDLGVGRDKLRATSRGELDATGTSEDGWAKDRRVDIALAE